MTSIYSAAGKNVPCTVIEAGPCVVTQVKSEETRWVQRSAAWIWRSEGEKCLQCALKGHFKKAGTTPKKELVEFQRLHSWDLILRN